MPEGSSNGGLAMVKVKVENTDGNVTTNGTSQANNKSAKSRKQLKKKLKKQKNKEKPKEVKQEKKNNNEQNNNNSNVDIKQEKKEDDDVEIVYASNAAAWEGNAEFEAFSDVFSKFMQPEDLMKKPEEQTEGENNTNEESKSDVKDAYEEVKQAQDEEDEEKQNKPLISKKEKKRLRRLQLPILKQIVARPDVVEVHDVNAADPQLLVFLKAYRNTVPVPRHWSQKRKYLQGKRGIEKPPFQLPDFIAATGISRIRQAIQEKEDQKKAKQKQREKMAPKMGKLNIDYQVLQDAFFKYQTKPKLSGHGDIYFEGKENEVKLKEKVPGQLSAELKKALGMVPGAPPPWLFNQQRFGPPPSYPNLKIPGVNDPLPPGATYGYHPGGWGKPPVDEFDNPLYGDVFGTTTDVYEYTEPVDRSKFGELEEEEDESESEAEEEEEAEEEGEGEGEGQTEEPTSEDIKSGISSIPSGLETPETLDLRKQKSDERKQLYQVVEQVDAKAAGFLGTAHKYVVPGAPEKVDLMKSQKSESVNITLNPSELENMEGLPEDLLRKKFDAEVKNQKEKEGSKEDFSDMVAEHERKKRKLAAKGKDEKKKYKDFKF
eukprot:TRINITY_DN2575_c0_g1_i1.p1 TRINITY_DN2575_c0_g1~~TRINITY_DN2575_c0_g1_i1.p1  ORF type:complete len:601 (-),score=252.13 TRINITY_DN2575_c0_g1_i1:78-1880(-)